MKKLLIIATMLFVTSSARADRIIVTEQTKWLFGTGGAHPEMKTDLININKCVAPIFERHRPKTPLQLAEAKKNLHLIDGWVKGIMFVNCIEEVNTILMHGMALYYLDGTLWTAFYDDINPELVKLDDLRKRGILTDTEFDAQKKKLLEGK